MELASVKTHCNFHCKGRNVDVKDIPLQLQHFHAQQTAELNIESHPVHLNIEAQIPGQQIGTPNIELNHSMN